MSAELASTSAQLFAAVTTRASSISQAQMPLSPAECVRIMGGGVGERLKPAVLKTVRPERVSGVRISPPPPFVMRLSVNVSSCFFAKGRGLGDPSSLSNWSFWPDFQALESSANNLLRRASN